MTLDDEVALSFYREIADFGDYRDIKIVQHTENGRIFLKKILRVYDREAIGLLKKRPVKGMPRMIETIEDGDRMLVIEQYISGLTLQELVQERVHFSEQMTKTVLCQLTEIVDALHTSAKPPVVHRDIKPSNVMVTDDGAVYLLDVDAAHFVNISKEQDSVRMGTPGFAAPEQYGFGVSTVQSDIYALGVLANWMLTGEVAGKCRVSCSLSPVIRKCLQMNPTDRYESAYELERALLNTVSEREQVRLFPRRETLDIADGGGYDEYFCPNCQAILNEQPGYDPGDIYWICQKCGEVLFDEGLVENAHRFPDTVWFCDRCRTVLNLQYGFDDRLKSWECAECGHKNRISVLHIRPRHLKSTRQRP